MRLKSLFNKNIFVFTIGILCAWIFSGFILLNFFLPKSLWGDHIFLLIIVKTFIDWNSFFSNNSLGYPGTFTWIGFPYSDYSQRILLFLAAIVSKNAVFATNLYYLLIVSLIFSSSYFVLLKYTKNIYYSLFGSLMFVLTPYFEVRSTGHDLLAAYYCIPWAFYLFYEIILLKPEKMHILDFKFFFRIPIILSLLILASSGVYYTAFSGMFLMASSLFLALRRKNIRYFYLGIQSTTIILILLIILFSPFLMHLFKENIHLPSRSFTEQPLVGVRISDNLWTLSNYFKNPYLESYSAWRSSPAQSPEGYDFWPGILLSTFSIVSIFFIPYFSGKTINNKNEGMQKFSFDHEILFILCSYVILLLLTAVPYGLGLIFNFLFTPDIRNYNRLSPFFTFASIILFALVLKTNSSNIRFLSKYVYLLVAAFFVLNCYPVFLFISKTQSQLLNDGNYSSEIKSIHSTLASIHKFHLKHIYQGPEIFWPEAPEIQRFDSYDHALLYIFDKDKSSVRWSYGLMSNVPEYHLLSMIEAEKDRNDSAVQLSCLGFDGIVLERRGYSDGDIHEWTKGLQQNAGSTLIHSDPLRIVFKLPSPNDYACQNQKLFSLNQWLPLRKGWSGSNFLLNGWSESENWGTWGIGPSQSIFIPVVSNEFTSAIIMVDVRALLTDRHPFKKVQVIVNGVSVETLIFTQDHNIGTRKIVIPRRLIEGRKIILEFSSRHPVSPALLGINKQDVRPISFGISRIKVCFNGITIPCTTMEHSKNLSILGVR